MMKMPVSDNFLISEENLPLITQLAESIPGGFFIYHADGDQELIYFNSHLVKIFGCDNDEDFRKLVGNSFKGIVHPDDYAENENAITSQIEESSGNLDHVKYRFIRKDGSIGYMDDYGHFSHSESFGDVYYVFVQDITKEEQERQRAAQAELMRGMLDYDGVFLLDCVNDTRRTIHDRLSGAANYDDAEKYSSAFDRYVETFVCEPDYEMMKGFVKPENILNILGERKELSVEYRDMTTGTQRFYEMRIIRYSDTEVLQCFRENDAEMVNTMLFEKLKDNYFAIFGVDLESDLMRSYKDDPLHVAGAEGEITSYSSTMKKLSSNFAGGTRAFFERAGNVRYIKERFAKEDRAEYIFKSAADNGKWVDVNGIVFERNADGEPSLFCLAFNFLDEESGKIRDLQEKLQEALDEAREANAKIAEQERLAGQAEEARKAQIAKISGKESTYIVNPETGQFTILNQTEHIADNYGEEGDFSTLFSRYIENDVFEPDREMVREAISIPAMVSHLNEEDEYVVFYRDISKGKPHWFEMRAVRLSETEILYGFSDVDMDVIQQMVSSSLEANYFGLYYVNLDSGHAQIVKTGHPEITGGVGAFVPYDNLMKNIAAASYGEAAEFFNKISDINYIIKRFATEDFSYHVYKSYIFDDDRWVNYTGRILRRHEDGTPALFALALSLLDEQASAKEEADLMLEEALAQAMETHKQMEADARVIGALSEDFGCVDYVEIGETKADDISAGVRVSETMLRILPEWESIGTFSDKMRLFCNKLVYEPDREKFRNAISRENVLKKLSRSDIDFFNIRLLIDDEIRYYQAKLSAVREGDKLVGIVAGIRSVDEYTRKELEVQGQLKDALDKAESANRAKTDFLFNMSHDIRTPMNAITGFTMMARKHVDDKEKINDYLEKIDTSSHQLLVLINEVLEMSRIESGKSEFKEEPVNITDEFNASVTVLSKQARDNGLEFHSQLCDIVHQNVFADTARMSSITLNITGNALKYTPRGGRIDYILREIPARKAGYATYAFTVEDTGIGMSEEFREHIFEPFTREQSSTVSRIQGTGLGMSIVKKLVDMLGGTIEVKSEQGKGTRFDVIFDFRINNEKEKKAEAKQESSRISFEGKRILLVEDNELNRDIAKDILGEEGVEVEEAEDGSVAVDMMRLKGPDYYDFILMDIQMPIMNGYEATRAIRAMYPDSSIPIIAISANAFEEDKKASKEAGMNDHVAKPVNVQELFEILAGFI